jgi:ABC-type sugar transport system ATPase subunit
VIEIPSLEVKAGEVSALAGGVDSGKETKTMQALLVSLASFGQVGG